MRAGRQGRGGGVRGARAHARGHGPTRAVMEPAVLAWPRHCDMRGRTVAILCGAYINAHCGVWCVVSAACGRRCGTWSRACGSCTPWRPRTRWVGCAVLCCCAAVWGTRCATPQAAYARACGCCRVEHVLAGRRVCVAGLRVCVPAACRAMPTTACYRYTHSYTHARARRSCGSRSAAARPSSGQPRALCTSWTCTRAG